MPLVGQTPSSGVKRDPQAIEVLQRATQSAGARAALPVIQDFTGTGTIVYYWAGEEVKGDLTVRGRGASQFRIDANLPEGMRSVVMNNGYAKVRETTGEVRLVPSQSTINFGSTILPLPQLAAALKDSSMKITDLGLVTIDGHQEHGVRLQAVFPAKSDPFEMRSNLSQKDFFLDPKTFLIVRTSDMAYRPGRTQGVLHEMVFSDYRRVDGILVPFSIKETIFHQPTSTMQLQDVKFDTGVTDSDFKQ
jgi:hypothetical protein